MSEITRVAQTSNPGEIVSLFRFDATSIGGPVLYFCQSAYETVGVTFGGVYYTPVDVEFSGLEINGTGVLPTPHIKLANTNGTFQNIVNTYGDMLGCVIQRVRTFRRFLDGETEADPSAYYGPDSYRVERKVTENPVYIEWELSASIDQEGKKLPGRQVIKDICLWRYRAWDSTNSQFDYSKVQCPWAGNATTGDAEGPFFDHLDQPLLDANKSQDKCGRRISSCELRFGVGQPLPIGAFPGVARVRS